MSDLTIGELWSRYIDLGGSLSLAELQEYLSDESTWTAHAHNIAAFVLNDHLAERNIGALVPYSFDL